MIRLASSFAIPAVSLCLLLAGCASDDGYSGYGGNTSVAVGVGYGYGYGYPGSYYPYYPPGYGCCWDGNDGRPPPPPPGHPGHPDHPDRPTTLPASPGQLPAERPNHPTPQPAQRPAHQPTARPAPRPTPPPRPMGGGGRRR
jgi:hypothetical protein